MTKQERDQLIDWTIEASKNPGPDGWWTRVADKERATEFVQTRLAHLFVPAK